MFRNEPKAYFWNTRTFLHCKCHLHKLHPTAQKQSCKCEGTKCGQSVACPPFLHLCNFSACLWILSVPSSSSLVSLTQDQPHSYLCQVRWQSHCCLTESLSRQGTLHPRRVLACILFLITKKSKKGILSYRFEPVKYIT